MPSIEVPSFLVTHQSEIQRVDPLKASAQAIDYQPAAWERRLGADDPDLGFLARNYPTSITRGAVAELARIADAQRDAASARRLFVGAMIWGFGDLNYGPFRTSEMLKAQNLTEVLLSTLDLLRAGEVKTAYEKFQLPWCGSAYFTKFFYFAGLGSKAAELPLILDTVVLSAFEQYLGLEADEFARYSRDKQGRIEAVDRDAVKYVHYVKTVNGWARSLGCGADSIELFLFKQRDSKA